ncbi:MAG TPA: hypothetical protein VMV79_00435, partial [Alphaproteobacteria bacterium]|nr:hypothetical protein [Alphaproteobacteria bacterium]
SSGWNDVMGEDSRGQAHIALDPVTHEPLVSKTAIDGYRKIEVDGHDFYAAPSIVKSANDIAGNLANGRGVWVLPLDQTASAKFGSEFGGEIKALGKLYKQIAAAHGVPTIDPNDPAAENTRDARYYHPENIHIGPQGYRKIDQKIEAGIERLNQQANEFVRAKPTYPAQTLPTGRNPKRGGRLAEMKGYTAAQVAEANEDRNNLAQPKPTRDSTSYTHATKTVRAAMPNQLALGAGSSGGSSRPHEAS